VLATDCRDYIAGIGLAEHLSPNRRAGMEHFIERVYAIAAGYDTRGAKP
jgi:sulfur transfer protein SufE